MNAQSCRAPPYRRANSNHVTDKIPNRPSRGRRTPARVVQDVDLGMTDTMRRDIVDERKHVLDTVGGSNSFAAWSSIVGVFQT